MIHIYYRYGRHILVAVLKNGSGWSDSRERISSRYENSDHFRAGCVIKRTGSDWSDSRRVYQVSRVIQGDHVYSTWLRVYIPVTKTLSECMYTIWRVMWGYRVFIADVNLLRALRLSQRSRTINKCVIKGSAIPVIATPFLPREWSHMALDVGTSWIIL